MKIIPLTRGYVTLVDDEDYDRLSAFGWHSKIQGERKIIYASRLEKDSSGVWRTINMHSFIMGQPWIDHADHDGLNNQRYNLRPATRSQNCGNRRKQLRPSSSRWKGVCWDRPKGKWAAYIGVNSKLKHLGYFADEADAATVYNFAALEHFGEFAKFNQPVEP
jgi:hypothetical protein